MKSVYLLIISIFVFAPSFSQGFPTTDSLRIYNIKYITNNPNTAFTNYRLNTLLRGIIDWVDTARTGGSGSIGIDTIGVLNDSTIRYRKNGVWTNKVVKGVYDTRRKVDSAMVVNDTTLRFVINGINRDKNIVGRSWTLQGVLNNGSTLTGNTTITLLDSIRFASGNVSFADSAKFYGPIIAPNVPTGTTSDRVLVYNTSTKEFKQILQSDLAIGDSSLWQINGSNNLVPKNFSGNRVEIPGKQFRIIDSGLVAIGVSGGVHPSPGSGFKMFWHPGKAAFRAGFASGAQFDDVGIGNASAAFGLDASASGLASFAAGNQVGATAEGAAVFGGGSTASGQHSFAAGSGVTASAGGAVAFGVGSVASGGQSFAAGNTNIASGLNSVAFNFFTHARAEKSATFGNLTTTNISFRIPQFSIGWKNDTARAGELFRIGWGSVNNVNVFAVDTLGRTKIASLETVTPNHAIVVWDSSDSLLKKRADIYSDTYTPTITNIANIDASTAVVCQYTRIGNVVTVSGAFQIDATDDETLTELGISLPVASDFSVITNCSGHISSSDFILTYDAVQADVTNNRAYFKGLMAESNLTYFFTFTYLVQ